MCLIQAETLIGSSELIYLDGVKVGDAAQTTSRVNLVVTPSDLFKFNISMFTASDLYADFNVEDFTSPEDEAMMLPSYDLFDFGASYKLDIAGETVYLRANINNMSLIIITLQNQLRTMRLDLETVLT